MSIFSAAKIFYLCHLSKPAGDRSIYRLLHQGDIRRILELGIGTGTRAMQMIEVAATQIPRAEIQYTGMDLFEARAEADGPGLSLKSAHQTLRATGARIQLLPGDPLGSLIRVANSLGKVDLLIFSAGIDLSHPKAWWFVRRLLHDHTHVAVEERLADKQLTLGWKPREEIERLAAAAGSRRAA